MLHWWSEEEIEFLRKHYVSHSKQELLDMFNSYFNVAVSDNQLKGALTRYKVVSGRTGRFKKGQSPANKGRKGIGGWEPTQFKKGNIPPNYKPVGTERVTRDDYVEVKIADPNKWRGKHLVVWEQANGPLPKGHVVIFGDRNRRNFDLDNLICVSRAQLARLNQNGLIQDDAELTRTGVVIADILQKMGERKKDKRVVQQLKG